MSEAIAIATVGLWLLWTWTRSKNVEHILREDERMNEGE